MEDEDHSSLDYNFHSKQMAEDGKIADISEELRNSKKALRDFEATMEDELPKLQSLEKFRDYALTYIEGKHGSGRHNRRTERELKELEAKLKKL